MARKPVGNCRACIVRLRPPPLQEKKEVVNTSSSDIDKYVFVT